MGRCLPHSCVVQTAREKTTEIKGKRESERAIMYDKICGNKSRASGREKMENRKGTLSHGTRQTVTAMLGQARRDTSSRAIHTHKKGKKNPKKAQTLNHIQLLVVWCCAQKRKFGRTVIAER